MTDPSTQTLTPHPARFGKDIMDAITFLITGEVGAKWEDKRLDEWYKILDPFAGTGRIHNLMAIPGVETVGVELEPEWADQHPNTIVGNALHLDSYFLPESFDAVVTSPCYGNRMADHHDARDSSRRNTYKHSLGRDLSPDSSAAMQWGDEYRAFHWSVWAQCLPLIKPGGVMIINCKDHIRGGKRQYVTDWHVRQLSQFGMYEVVRQNVDSRGNRQGANGKARVDHETVVMLRKPLP